MAIKHSVADLVEEPEPRRLAGPEAYEQGWVLVNADQARLARGGPLLSTVDVVDGTAHVVELRSTEEGLTWACDCPAGAAGAFCAHCVAAAVVTWRSAPKRRR